MAQLLAALTSRHSIALVYLRSPDEPPLDDIFYERCDLIEEVPRLWTGRSLAQRAVRNGRIVASLLSLRPMWVTDWASEQYHERVRTLAQVWQPDIVQIEYHVMGQYLLALDGYKAPCILVEHEPGVYAAPYLKGLHPAFNRLAHSLDKIAWKRFELGVIRKVQAVVVFTERDRRAIEGFGLQTPIWRIPVGTMIPDQPLNPLGRPPLSLLFVGNFLHPPNIEAALRLARKILPPVQQQFPELKLYIVGQQPPPELIQISGDHIVVTGRVPDLTPYLDQAALVVVPMRLGSGMRVKVLEAVAAGKAVVASPLAVEGLEVSDGDQLSIAENDQQMSASIVKLLSNPEQRAALARRARDWACANLGWDKPVAQYEALYESLCV
jgi:glycosyltransferase involved in cell wall biosynthesis